MPREVDEKSTRKALSRIRRAKAAVERAIAKAEQDDPDAAEAAQADLTDWEAEFMASVEQRLNEYGSAYADPTLGEDGEALSRLQIAKLKEIEKKARGKGPKGFKRGSSFKARGDSFKRKGAPVRARGRDINADVEDEAIDAMGGETPGETVPGPLDTLEQAGQIRRGLNVVEGGAHDDAAPREGGTPRLRVIDGGKDDD